ncbi:MAG: hypothetical protein A2Z29_09255 [Chloroflexi bacterium RBG_16_56_11]|nr:MAG: hypothetical protein A2Z29_09255 [Chloroflexi bacterium RBG_16_56_11]
MSSVKPPEDSEIQAGKAGQKASGPGPWRRLWHVAGGSAFPVLAFFVSRNILLIVLGAAIIVVIGWEIVRLASPGVNQWIAARLRLLLKKKERFQLTGTTYLLLASLATFFFFEKYVAITSLLFLSLGDFMAAAIGVRFGKHKLLAKSLEGSLACLASCLIIGTIMTVTGTGISLPVAFSGAFTATIVELLPIPPDDNLTIPLFSALVMTLTAMALGWF